MTDYVAGYSRVVAERDRLRAENEALRRAILKHQQTLASVGEIRVADRRSEERATRKNEADEALWRLASDETGAPDAV